MSKKTLILCLFSFLLFSQIASAEQIRLGIMPFVSRTSEVSESQAAAISDIITRTFQASPSIAVVERERLRVIAMEKGLKISSNNQDSAAALGKLAGCQYILLGSVTQLAQRYLSSTKLTWFLGSSYSGSSEESQEATARLEARLIDVSTGRVMLSFSQAGSAIISGVKKSEYFYRENTYSKNTLAMKAVEAASSRLADEVRETLANEYAMIISITKNNIRINRGTSLGVNVGSFYKVYQEGEEIFDLNGKSLGKRKINLALLRVLNVQNDFSDVEIIERDGVKDSTKKNAKTSSKAKTKRSSKSRKSETENAEKSKPILIREGDKIEAISFAEAEKLNLANKRIGEDK